MTDIPVSASQAGVIYPDRAEIYPVILNEAVTALQAAYLATTGKFGIAGANAAGKQQFRGVFLRSGAAGEVVPLLVRGHVYGFTVSGVAYDTILYLSDTPGSLGDAAGTKSVPAARIVPMPDGSNLSKVVFVNANITVQY